MNKADNLVSLLQIEIIVYWCLIAVSLLPMCAIMPLCYATSMCTNKFAALMNVSGYSSLGILGVIIILKPVLVGLSNFANTHKWQVGKRQSDWNSLFSVVKPLGLIALAYATLHALIFFHFEVLWLFEELIYATKTRSLLAPGLLSMMILMLMGLSSNRLAKRMLGVYWKKLHRGIFIVVVLGLLHVYLDAKPADTYHRPILVLFTLILSVRVLPLLWKPFERNQEVDQESDDEIEGKFAIRNRIYRIKDQ